MNGQLTRSRKPVLILGLNTNHHHTLKAIFKEAAVSALAHPGTLQEFYAVRVAQGMKPELARLALARIRGGGVVIFSILTYSDGVIRWVIR